YTGKQGSYGFRVGRARGLSGSESELCEALGWLCDRDEEQAELEADDRRVREDGSQRAEPPEGARRRALGEEGDGCRGARIGVVGRQPHSSGELALGRDAAPKPPEEIAVTELGLGVGPARVGCQHAELCGAARRARELQRQNEVRQPGLV